MGPSLDPNPILLPTVTNSGIMDHQPALETNDAKESPTKEELKRENFLLKKELDAVKKNLGDNLDDNNENEDRKIYCEANGCSSYFFSSAGLFQHLETEHNDHSKPPQLCRICSRYVKYLDQHYKRVHKQKKFCDVCRQWFSTNFKDHRRDCYTCPICLKEEPSKIHWRLINHIKECKGPQTKVLDLSTPKKKDASGPVVDVSTPPKDDSCSVVDTSVPMRNEDSVPVLDLRTSKKDSGSVVTDVNPADMILLSGPSTSSSSEMSSYVQVEQLEKSFPISYGDGCCVTEAVSEDALSVKRKSFPFEDEDNENYISEHEESDLPEFTVLRRAMKDKLIIDMKKVDEQRSEKLGDLRFVDDFRAYLRKKKQTHKNKNRKEVSTIRTYGRMAKNYLLRACHNLITPFRADWLLDPLSLKEYDFMGTPVKSLEPIHLSSVILDEALNLLGDNIQENGNNRALLLATTMEVTSYITWYHHRHVNVHGIEPIKSAVAYHDLLKSYIDSTGMWSSANFDKKAQLSDNKTLKDHEDPQRDLNVLLKLKEYFNSGPRMDGVNALIKFSRDNSEIPSAKDYAYLTHFVMGEQVITSGKRPKVIYDLPNGSYRDKKAGFDPKRVSRGDKVPDERSTDGDTLYRRVNPTLPPKHLACQHQIESKCAECPVYCEDRYEPEGYNVTVSWDKNSLTNGISYMHISKISKILFDLYEIVKYKYFAARMEADPEFAKYLYNDDTNFFLNSKGSVIDFINLKHMSEFMGIDVTSYSFRKIMVTFALSHEDQTIRDCEESSLQHSLRVAGEFYLQNAMLKPQTLTARYVEEEEVFPQQMKDIVMEAEKVNCQRIKNIEAENVKRRINNLIMAKVLYKEHLEKNKVLGPKHRILFDDREVFIDLIEKIAGEKIDTYLLLKPKAFRKLIVRLVCSSTGELGDRLRSIWVKMYGGDLVWGIRDARWNVLQNLKKKGKAKGSGNDRISWVCRAVRNSLLKKVDDNQVQDDIQE